MKSKIEDTLENMNPKHLTENEKNFLWSRVEEAIHDKKQAENKVNSNPTFWNFILHFSHAKYIFVPALIIAFLAGSISTTIVFANNSNPGDFLFPIDIAVEKILLTITFGDTEDSFRLRFSEERIDEVKALLLLASSIEVVPSIENGTSTATSTDSTTTEDTSTTTGSITGEDTNNTSTGTSTETVGQEQNNETSAEENTIHRIEQANDALGIALSYLEENRAILEANGNDAGVFALNQFIDELTVLAEDHVTKISEFTLAIKNNGDNQKVKIKLLASTNEVKSKFRFDSKINGDNDIKQQARFEDDEKKITLKLKTKEDSSELKFSVKEKDDDKGKRGKVRLCHDGKKTVTVHKTKDVDKHLEHGDTFGPCEKDHDNNNDDGDGADDTTAPVLSSVTAVAATTTAQILWNTDENADSRVFYSTTTPVEPNSANKVEDANFVVSHEQTLSSLTASTTYYYFVVSNDEHNNAATSSEHTFTTLSVSDPIDTTAPVLSSVTAVAATTTAQILWNTDENADSRVFYSTTTPVEPNSANKVEDANFVVSHEQTLSSLTASTTYYYLVISTDAVGNTATSTEHLFETLTEPEPVDETAPVLSNIVANATTTEATITWNTDEEADSTLWYGTTTPIALEEALFKSDATLTVNHSLSIFGLSTSTTYYYIVISSDLLSNTASSTEQTFVTLEI